MALTFIFKIDYQKCKMTEGKGGREQEMGKREMQSERKRGREIEQ